MRRLTVLLLTLAMFVLSVPAASAAIHPLIGGDNCGEEQVPGMEQAARSDDICNPPGITPDGVELPPGNLHLDILMAADDNPVPQFRPLIATLCAPSENAGNNSWKVPQGEIDGTRAVLCP